MRETSDPDGPTLRVGEATIELLVREYGVDTVFGIPGVHNIELYRGLHRFGMRAVSPRHEQGAGFMADGWSIVTGKPGVCALITGPGLTNALTPIAQAFHDSRPMLVLASTTDRASLGRRFGPLHDLDDQAAIARTVTAFSETVLDPADVPALLARAWEVFMSRRPRPVHLAFPTDVLEEMVAPFRAVGPLSHAAVADADAVDRAAAMLGQTRAGSSATVVLVGGGAIDAGHEVLAVAELLDAAVVLTGNAKGVVASSHPRCSGNVLGSIAVQHMIEVAPAVLVVGSELSDADLYNGGRALEFCGRVVRIDLDHEQVQRRVVPDVALVGDAAQTLRRLIDRLDSAPVKGSTAGVELAESMRVTAAAETRAELVPWIDAIAASLPTDAIVALDSTQLAYAAHVALPCERPRSWLAPYGLGTLGCAVPMAIGAGIAAPDRPVLAIVGDGGWLFTVAEMATALDERIDLVVILWDNRGYAQIRQSFDDVDAPRVGVNVSSADPAAIARGFGWSARRVGTPDALADAIEQAFVAGGPQMVVVDVPSS